MEYDELRYSLFIQSYVASELVKKLRGISGISRIVSFTDRNKQLTKNHWNLFLKHKKRIEEILGRTIDFNASLILVLSHEIEKEITPDIERIAKKLNINSDLFRVLVLYNNVTQKIYPPDRIFYAQPGLPLTEPGVYIKIDENLRARELEYLFKKAKLAAKLFSKGKDKQRRKDVAKDDKVKSKIYIAVEKEIKKLIKSKEKGEYEGEDLYSDEIVSGAIENVAQKELDRKNIKDDEADRLFPEYIKRTRTYYYEITRRYSLPTIKKLPSILRLMST